MKKLMLLGGSRYLLSVIETAHRLGVYVITCDYLPDNIAHKFSDKYINVSVIDKKTVLEMAKKESIDGIMSFACDPGVVTAAYVAEKLGLPFQGSYKAVKILQDKGLFREFLTTHGFNVPNAKRYVDINAPYNDLEFFNWPIIVKPVDSAGSKGVTRVERKEDLAEAIENAVNGSKIGAFIIEDFLTFEGYHSSSDLFTINGDLKFVTYSDQLFDENADNPYTPSLIIWPSSMKKKHQDNLTKEIQRLMYLLKMKNGMYNVETCVGADGKEYIMEVSPRGGGCKIADIQKLAFGVDLIENDIRSALDMPLNDIASTKCDGVWCEKVIHSHNGEFGILDRIDIDLAVMDKYVKLVDLSVKKGDAIKPFTGANMAVGDMFLRFDSREELDAIIKKTHEWLKFKFS